MGDGLATLHFFFSLGASSEKVRRFVQAFSQATSRDAAKLEIELPPEALSDSFDPRATEVIRRIALSKGKMTAGFFEFSYHAKYAALAAHELSSVNEDPRRWPPGTTGFLELDLLVHADVAVRAASGLELPKETLDEGRAIAAQVGEIARGTRGGDRAREFEAISNRLWTWHSRIATGVPFELRLRSQKR